jgi:glycosyltransferase involved in cell wall biosynthesis
MKIVITIDFSPWSKYSGGAQRSSHYMAEAHARNGHDVTVVFTKPPWESVQVPEKLPYKLRWATHHGLRSTSKTPFRPLNSVSVRRLVRDELSQGIPTVVHCNGEEGALLSTLKKSFSFGLVSTPRHPDYPKVMYNDRLSPVQSLRLALTNGKYLAQKRAARGADLCVPPSRFAADIVQKALKVEGSRVRVVNNGVPPEFLSFHYDSDRAVDGPIVFFGRFNPNKGADVLLRAYAASGLQNQHELWLIGRGPMEEDLAKLISAMGLGEYVQIPGWKTHDELGAILQSCAFVVLPSLEENFSLAVLGACCVGAPVISTTVGGTPEIIVNNETGILVEPGSVNELQVAMTAIATNRRAAVEMGRKGSERIRTLFTWKVGSRKFLSIYQELLAAT